MSENFATVADIRRNSGWREALEEHQNYEAARRKREGEAEQQVRKAREAEKQQVASTNWYAAIDGRIHEHLKTWLWKAIDEHITQWWINNAIDERITESWDIQCEPFKDAIGEVLGTIRAELRKEFKQAIGELCDASGAEIAALEKRLANNIEVMLAHERNEFKRVIEEVQRLFGTEIAALEGRLRAVPGKLPVAKTWCQESVTYQAEFVVHEGALWQACRDTAQAPGGSDWVCVARGGRDGLSLSVRGAFNAYKKYAQLDVVTFDGASFVATRNNPGICPGDGWQMLAPRGKAGDRGPSGSRGAKGEKGARGEATPTIVHWAVDPVHYRAVPMMSDGKPGEPLNLRPLFEQYCQETS